MPERYAVIDAGTNSTKFHVAELDADGHGAWRTVVDRAVVTRLGEGLEATGEIGAEPLERTAQAISEMADEARGLDARAIALGRHGRTAHGWQPGRGRRDGSGSLRAVRSTSSRARTRAGSPTSRSRPASGSATGRSSASTPAAAARSSPSATGRIVDERFSLNVGAVRFTEQFGLAKAVSRDVVAEALAAIAAELARLDGRPRPDAVVAMGGAVTNLAAVKHGLATYDPDVVQGTVLDRAEIDRQIELYRTLDADGRREIAGLQPARAEVILAGACIVRTIIDKLGCDAVTVSDRGLRHGVLLERFGSGSA